MGVPLSSASPDRRDDILRLLAETPDGLSDAALTRALGGPTAGVCPATVNALCRRMVTAGLIERVGTRPIRNRTRNGTGSVAPAEQLPGTRAPRTRPATISQPAEPAEPATTSPDLRRDAAQAWTRPVNVQAAVASWLTDRGATIRTATDGDHGPARDLVASLDGADVHVEITGWPPDEARTHPTTIAGDWFHAAEDAARVRRSAHPHARIVIALPDTRRYRALRAHRADALAGARAEVWFVDPSGEVEA